MKEIIKSESEKLTESSTKFQIITNEEDGLTKSFVTLKKIPSGYVLEVSCDSKKLHKIYFSEDFTKINNFCSNFLSALREKGNPFANNGMSKEELVELAAQLSNPHGEKGIQVGHQMNETNIFMIRNTLEHLTLKDDDHILELGHGNANHLKELFQMADRLKYVGLDISETMKAEAENYCSLNNIIDKTIFELYDGQTFRYEDNSFDKIFTVNTLYFWKSPAILLNEINRVLKPGGTCCITFIDEESMNQLSFTEHGFTKYSDNRFQQLVNESNLVLSHKKMYSEMTKSKMFADMERRYWVMMLKKG